MKPLRKLPDQAEAQAALRRAAAARLKGQPAIEPPQTETEQQRLLQELAIHKIELQIQNEELQASHDEIEAGLERYSELFDFAPVGYFDLSADGTIRLVNRAGANLVGLERARLPGRCFQDWLTEPDRTAFSDLLQRVFATKTRQARDITLLKPDQTRLHAHLEAHLSPDGGSCHLALSDITERQQVEAALSQKTSELTERVKELECLYEMSKLVAASDKSMEEIFKEAVYLVLPGYHYPKIACARIAIGEEQFMTDNFRQTPWRLAADLVASGTKLGSVEVCYLEERPARDEGPFLKEERSLIDNLARQISATVERRRAKMVLQQSEEKLRAMTERQMLAARAGGVGIWDYDVVSDRLVWDDQMFELYGITRDRFGGAYEAWQAGLRPEDRQRGDEEIRLALRGEKEFNTEFRVLWPDGTTRTIRARATVQRDASGQPTHMVGTNWDITTQKQAEAALAQSERRFRTMFKEAPLGVALIDSRTGHICEANPKFAEIAGRTHAEMIVRDWMSLTHPDDVQAALDNMARLNAGEIPGFDMNKRYRRPDGSYVWIHMTIAPFEVENRTSPRHLCMIEDITARRQTEEARAQLAQIVEYSEDAIIGKDLQGIITSWNGGAEKIFGHAASEMVGTSIRRLIPEEHQPEGDGILAKIRLGESVEHFETVRLTRDGRLIDVSVTASPIKDAVGKVIGVSKMARDITERKRLEAQNRALQKAESLSRMAGAIAHNFNNQLAAVMLNLELLQQERPPQAGANLSLAEALKSVRKAANISTQMLVYLGQAAVQREPLDLSAACRLSLPLLQSANPYSAALKTDLPTPGPVVKANANRIQQVLTNLLTNAWEAGSNGSKGVRLTIKQVSTAEIPAAQRFPIRWQPRDAAYACLEVADTGCGITAGDMEKIFDPFFTSKFTGRGLGLAVVLGIVREHGGGITVESEPGRGSVFRVFLPVTVAAVPPRVVPVAPAPKPAVYGTVLVVEDEPSLRAMFTQALQREGFKVFAAKDGVAGVELFEQHRDEIQCVVCDLAMPRLDGWGTLTALRQLVPGLPVILSSGYDNAQVMAGQHPELPQAFLQKPYQFEELIKVINQVWPQARVEKREGSS